MSHLTKMVALESFLRSTAGPRAVMFNEANRLEDLRNQMIELNEQMNNIQARADAEKRSLSADETTEIETLFAQFEDAENEIERRERLIDVNARMAAPAGRQTDPNKAEDVQNLDERPKASKQRDRVAPRPRDPNDTGKWGFNSFGEFARSVKDAVRSSPGSIDPRLIANAPTSYGQEGVGADGGFAVPPDFRQEIMVKVMGEESLLGRTDQLQSSSNSITMPKDETTPWQTTGGVQAYWESEAGQLTQSKPSLQPETIRLNKLTSLVPVTEELLEDAPALSTYLRRKAPEKMQFRVNDAIVNGTGAGMPKGILSADALVTQTKESGQAADTIVFANIVNMWSRLYSGCRSNAVWLINQDIEPQLMSLQFPGSGTAVPVYLPPGGLSNSPYGTLMGKPVIPTEACQTLGDAGDIILADLSKYMTATKTGGIRQDVSMHLWFDYDMLAFRFIMRVAGQPWWGSAITPKNGSLTRSCFVALEAR